MSAWNDDRNFEESINSDQFVKEISENLLKNFKINNTVNASNNFNQQPPPLNINSYYNRNPERQTAQPSPPLQQQQNYFNDHQKSKVNINHFKRVIQNTTQFNKSIDRSLLSESRIATDRKIEDERMFDENLNDNQRFATSNIPVPTRGRGSPFGKLRSSDTDSFNFGGMNLNSTGNEHFSDQKIPNQDYLSRQPFFDSHPSSAVQYQSANNLHSPSNVVHEKPKNAQMWYNQHHISQPQKFTTINDEKFEKYPINQNSFNMKSTSTNNWSNNVHQRSVGYDRNRGTTSELNSMPPQSREQQYGRFENQAVHNDISSKNKSMESMRSSRDANGNFSNVQTRQNCDSKLPNARPLNHGYYEVYLCGETRNDAIANRIEKTVRNTECPPQF